MLNKNNLNTCMNCGVFIEDGLAHCDACRNKYRIWSRNIQIEGVRFMVRRCKKCNQVLEDVDLDICHICKDED